MARIYMASDSSSATYMRNKLHISNSEWHNFYDELLNIHTLMYVHKLVVECLLIEW